VLVGRVSDGRVLAGGVADEQLRPGELGRVHPLVGGEFLGKDDGGGRPVFGRDDEHEVRLRQGGHEAGGEQGDE
jgi:hypothetical protein